MENEVKAILFGLGPMGEVIVKGILEKKGLRVVGAVNVLKDKVWEGSGESVEVGQEPGSNSYR